MIRDWPKTADTAHPAAVTSEHQPSSRTTGDLSTYLLEAFIVSSSEHAVDRNRRRAEAVHALLEELWGDDLPPGPSPQVTALIDALVGDDHFGRLNGYLVHGDQVSYEAVTTLIRLCRTPEIIADLLGPALVDRITDSVGRSADGDIQDWTDGHLPQADTPPGAWYLDAQEQTLSWDSTCAQLLQRSASATCCTLNEELGQTHPDDREAVAHSWRRCIEVGESHQVWFRTRTPAGEYRAYRATGRRVVDGRGRVHVVGFLYDDR